MTLGNLGLTREDDDVSTTSTDDANAVEDTTGSFAADTAVTQVGEGRWRGELSERWSSLVGIHGGYVAAVAARAIAEAVADPDRPLRTLSAQFLRSPRPGPVEVDVTVERRGRSLVFTSARVHQGDRSLVLVRGTSAGAADGLTYDDHRDRPVAATPPAGAERFLTESLVRHFEQVEVVMDPEVVPFSGRGPARLAAWLRPLGGEAIDTAWLVMAGDVLPPASFARTTGPTRAATLDYSVHLPLADPGVAVAPGQHVFLECRSPLAADGMAVEDGALWGPDGTVLAVTHQTRLADQQVPRSFAAAPSPAMAPPRNPH
jgi:acyl-CoA thioesterase